MRKWIVIVAMLLLVLVAIIFWRSHRTREVDAAPLPVAWLKSVTVEAADKKVFAGHEIVEASLSADANLTTVVSLPVSGRVAEILVQAGDRVNRNQVLALIESPDFSQLTSDLYTSKVALAQNEAAVKRKQVLHDAGSISSAEYEQAITDAANAQAAYAGALQRAKVLGLNDSEIADLSTKLPAKAYWPLKAPLAGVVLDRQLSPNQYVSAGNSVITIADTSRLWVVGEAAEAAATKLHVGQSVTVVIGAQTLTSKLNYVAAAVDPITHRFTIRAEIGNPDNQLKPQMLAMLKVALSEPKPVLAIAESAIIYEDAETHVWVVTPQSQLQYRKIELGAHDDGFAEVLKGLNAGERIVTKGGLFIDRSEDTSQTADSPEMK